LHREGDRVTAVEAVHIPTGERKTFTADYFISTMPVKDLIHGMQGVPQDVREVSDGLQYRDFITVGILLKHLKNGRELLSDNWIYVQEPDVLVGRIQIFNNWSPYLVKDPAAVWLGLEYFCYETDPI
jgi:protoporphyrinogen oxidase